MTATKPPLVARDEALRKTQARYRDRKFDWAADDCIRMARFHLRANGHRVPAVPAYKTALGARKALKGMKAKSVIELLDGLLPRIPFAQMLPGDLAAMKGTDGLDAVVICLGRKFWGWHEGAETPVPVIPHQIEAAWRVEPKAKRKAKR